MSMTGFPVFMLVVLVAFLSELGVPELVSQLAGDDAAVLDREDQVMAGSAEVAADVLTVIRNGCYFHVTSGLRRAAPDPGNC
jgi:hypothetical protein